MRRISGTMPAAALDPSFFELLTRSFERLLGRPLVPDGVDPLWLYRDAPFVVLAHDRQSDPCFVYANVAAQRLFGYGWDEFVGLPSRLSAEAPDRAERAALLSAVRDAGFSTGYRGMRVAKSGRRFMIERATIWQLTDEVGEPRGQAATFPPPSE